MSFICVICRDLLKISEEASSCSSSFPSSSPRHQKSPLLQNGYSTPTNHATSSTTATPTSSQNNNVVPGRKKEKNNSIVATKCGHLFHYPCLSVWLSQSMNLTTDSKMRCPSCKQLIYIYELIQLFPVENGGGVNGCWSRSTAEHLLSDAFQEKMKGLMGQLENLVRDLGNQKILVMGNNGNGGSLMKGAETTPTKHPRFKESPKKIQPSQLNDVIRELESVRASMKELSICIKEHAELGSILEKQSEEISELRSRNKQLIKANERLKVTDNENEVNEKTSKATQRKTDPSSSHHEDDDDDHHHQHHERQQKEIEQPANVKTKQHVDNLTEEPTQKTAQASSESPETSVEVNPVQYRNKDIKGASPVASSGNQNHHHRKSVTFVDPFEEFSEANTKTTIPLGTKDFRIGDKVLWSFEGNAEVGTVKWKGFVGSQINVGVEFEKQLGLPIKDSSCDPVQCIFKSKPGHGRLIPVYELTPLQKTDKNGLLKSSDRSKSSESVQSHSRNDNDGKRIGMCNQQ